jgi:hypothetical protein
MQKYNLVGRIATERSLMQSIRVYPFLEGAEVTGIIADGTGTPSPDFIIPNSEGSFVVELWLTTDSGAFSSGRDECGRKAKYVDVFIVGEGVRAKRVRVEFTWAKGMAPSGDAGIVKVEEEIAEPPSGRRRPQAR